MAALWVTVPCMYMYGDVETSYRMGSPLTWTAWVRISPKVDVQKVSTDGFHLETPDLQVHGRGDFIMLRTFYQGQESSLGAWLSTGLASKEGWPWVGRKEWQMGGRTASCSVEGSVGDFQTGKMPSP